MKSTLDFQSSRWISVIEGILTAFFENMQIAEFVSGNVPLPELGNPAPQRDQPVNQLFRLAKLFTFERTVRVEK